MGRCSSHAFFWYSVSPASTGLSKHRIPPDHPFDCLRKGGGVYLSHQHFPGSPEHTQSRAGHIYAIRVYMPLCMGKRR